MRPHPRRARSLLFIVPVAFALTIAAGGARAANPPATLPGASAGETPPRLVVEPSRVAPGETFTVHGFALGAQAQLTLLLVGSGDPVYLADVTADAGGDFTLAVNVPPPASRAARWPSARPTSTARW